MVTLVVMAGVALVLLALLMMAVWGIQHQLEAIASRPATQVAPSAELAAEELATIQEMLSQLTDRFDALLQAKGIDIEAYRAAKVARALERTRELVREGKPIHAMKAYRNATGCGVREAKDFVDSLRAEGGTLELTRFGGQRRYAATAAACCASYAMGLTYPRAECRRYGL